MGAHIFAAEDRAGIIAANLGGVRALLARTAGPGLAVHVVDAATNRPLAAQVWLPRIENETVDRRSTEATFGHYWRLLRPGKYELIISCPGYRTAVLHNVAVAAGDWTPLEVRLQPEAPVAARP